MTEYKLITTLLELAAKIIGTVEEHLGGNADPQRVEDILSPTSKTKLQDLRAEAMRRKLEEND